MRAHFILFVADQRAACAFYRAVLALEPRLDVPGMTEFELAGGAVLGLMPEQGIRRLLGERLPDPAGARGVPRVELYLVVDDVEAGHRRALAAGAVELSAAADREWGHRVSYLLDHDGHVLAFATPGGPREEGALPGQDRPLEPITVRGLDAAEHGAWCELRARLWPDPPRAELAAECELLRSAPGTTAVLVAADEQGRLVGFVEVSLRESAEGCDTRPVGYLEAWYVDPEHRRANVGRRLVEAGEAWARARGCSEFASDAELWNEASHAAHRALGFEEVARVVLYKKPIAR